MLSSQVPASPCEADKQQVAPSQPMNQTISLPTSDVAFISPQDLARLLRVTSDTIYRLVAKRALPSYRVLRRILLRRADVERWLAAHRTSPRDPSLWQ